MKVVKHSNASARYVYAVDVGYITRGGYTHRWNFSSRASAESFFNEAAESVETLRVIPGRGTGFKVRMLSPSGRLMARYGTASDVEPGSVSVRGRGARR